MKASIAAASAALVGSVTAAHGNHMGFHHRRGGENDVCTVYTTVYETAPAVANATQYVYPSPVAETPAPVPVQPYPTGEVSTCSTTGTYTFPAKTTTVTETTTVCGPTTTVVPAGTHTYGGVTTSVSTSTVLVVPYPSVYSTGSSYSTGIETTTYTCSTAGEHTIAPYTKTVTETETTLVYPTLSTFYPGTYTAHETTVTVTVPSAVYVCPYESSSTPAPVAPKPTKEAYTPKPVAPKPVESKPAAPAYTPKPVESPKPVAPKPKPSKTPSTPSYSGNGRIVTKGQKWSITYTPYTSGGGCKSAAEVEADIADIAGLGFTTIRSYSTDCGVFENVVPACQKHGLKVIYGIFLEAGGKGGRGPFSDYANNQLQEIISKAPKDSVAMIIVGNEALFNNLCTPEELAAYIDYCRTQLHSAGFPADIAITTTEPVGTWQTKGAALCSHIDVFACQVHPFFTSTVTASEAGTFAKGQLELAASVCPEAAAKGKYITEIGWPEAGNPNGAAVPGYSQQKEALNSILAEVGKEACIFSYQNDGWKNPGEFGVEQYFGCSKNL